jgi:hypothetical protein
VLLVFALALGRVGQYLPWADEYGVVLTASLDTSTAHLGFRCIVRIPPRAGAA